MAQVLDVFTNNYIEIGVVPAKFVSDVPKI